MQSITLEFVPGGVQPIVRVSQYDKTLRTFEVEMVMEGQPYEVADDHRILISGTKPDGKSFEYVCAFEANVVTVVVTEQMSAAHGNVACELTVYDGDDNRISSANFILRVEKAAMDADAVTSETDIAAITELVTEAATNAIASKESAEASASSAEDSKNSAEESDASAKDSAGSAVLSESWAIGGTGTREGEDKNNAMYYAGLSSDSAKASSDSSDESKNQADNSASSAEDSASSAKESVQSASDSAGSAVLSESWAIGGTGTREDEDGNNSKYYAEQSAGQAEAAKNSAEEAGNQAKDAENKAEAAAESAKEAAASAANFDDTDTTPEIEVTDFMSMISSDGNRYRKLVSDVAEAIIKKVSMTDLCGDERSVAEALTFLYGKIGTTDISALGSTLTAAIKAIDNYAEITKETITYASNTYFNEMSVNRCALYKIGKHIGYLLIDLNVSTAAASVKTQTKLFTRNHKLVNVVDREVPSQSNNSNALFTMFADGRMTFFASDAIVAGDWYRGVMLLLFS